MYHHTMRTWQIAISALLFQAGAVHMSCAVAHAESFRVTNPPPIQKVLPEKGDAGPAATTLRIPMCRGEYEPVQLVVHAGDKALSNVRISVGALSGPNGSVLPQDRITVNPMGFIQIEKPTMGGTKLVGMKGGEVPDVLLPDRAMDVPAGRRQPYYITVRTLQDDPPGAYRGMVRISASGEASVELPLLVRVYDIGLPIKSHLRTAFGLDTAYRRLTDAEPGADIDTLLQYSKFLLQHRVSPLVYNASVKKTKVFWRDEFWREDGTWDSSGVDRYLSELVPLGLTTFYTSWMAGVAAFADHLKQKGWWELAYVYGHDEARMDKLPKMKADYESIKKPVPDVRALQVGWSPTKQLEGLVSIWCPLISHADLEGLRQARERGEETWWYTWDGPWSPYPNICHMDEPGIYQRIVGWMTYAYEIQGFLYFAVDIWDTHPNRPPGGRLSAAEYDAANYATWNPNTYGKTSYGYPRNGDGYLIYPGKGNVPVASLRLALTRDGFEDYDLFTEVASVAQGDSADAVQARELIDFSDPFDNPVIISRTKWTKKDNVLLRRREEILKIGEQLRRPDDEYLRRLREQQTAMADTLYAVPEKDTGPKRKSGFGATAPNEAHYIDGADCVDLLPKLTTIEALPKKGWLFKADPDEVGVSESYFSPDYRATKFSEIKIAEFWDPQGHDGLSEGWYRLNYRCPKLPEGKPIYLHFGAVDEAAWLYVDGKLIAWYDTAYPKITWTQPFLLDVTGSLESEKEHLLVIRVQNAAGAGGIHKPVSLMVQKEGNGVEE